MAQNLGKPLYQDDSGIGVMIGLVVRGLWVWMGGIASVVLIIPFTLVFLINLLLPLGILIMFLMVAMTSIGRAAIVGG